MAWVIFTEDFDFYPTDHSTIAYKAGPEAVSVKRECADAAVAAGKATPVPTPSKSVTPADGEPDGDDAPNGRRTSRQPKV